jgi:hypothetical protein
VIDGCEWKVFKGKAAQFVIQRIAKERLGQQQGNAVFDFIQKPCA